MSQNYYGSLCTEMYEILHPHAPEDELGFYLSYARPGEKILEPLCGSGRFLVPMLDCGLDISGVDLSGEMLDKLRQKRPDAHVECSDVMSFAPGDTYDYIFISSGSVSLFTDIGTVRGLLKSMKRLLKPSGVFVFAVDTVACICPDDSDYRIGVSVKTDEGLDLILRSKNRYDPASQTQFSPSIYELRDGDRLIKSEDMDFQTHLYRLGEMDEYLRDAGFSRVNAYCAFDKTVAADDSGEMLLYECRI